MNSIFLIIFCCLDSVSELELETGVTRYPILLTTFVLANLMFGLSSPSPFLAKEHLPSILQTVYHITAL